MRIRSIFLPMFVALFSGLASAEEFLNPQVAFQPSARALDERTIEVNYRIAKGYYLYRDKFAVAISGVSPGLTLGPLVLPPGKMKKDENFGDTLVFFKEVAIRVRVERAAPAPSAGPLDLNLDLTSMGCADGGICYPPQKQAVSVTLPAPGSVPLLADITAPASSSMVIGDESAVITQLLRDASFWLVLATFFGFGLLLAFTPCMLPMLPILSGIIVGHGEHVTHRRAFALSLAYVLGMAITYAAIGVAAGLSGTLLSAAFQNPWVLSVFALVFVALALAMFGFYELQMPSFLQSKLSEEASHLKGGSYYSVATMGALSALIVGPCVAAPLAGALLYIGQTGDALLGGAALFVLALGMGAPLIAVGASTGHMMPKAGPWMEVVNKVFGVIMLATALWFLTPVIPAWVQMVGWALLLIVPAVFMHALDSLPPAAGNWRRFWKGIAIVMLVYGAALLVGALAGGRDPLQPLKPLTAGVVSGGAGGAKSEALAWTRVRSPAELDAQLKSAGKPVMLDFWAEWCVSCKEMERFTFSDPAVRARMDRFLLIKADVTANNADDSALLQRFGLFGPPGIIFFDAQGREIKGQRVIGFQNADAFVRQLDLALAASI